MNRPSPQLRAAIEKQIAADAENQELGAWPSRRFADDKLLFLTGNDAFFWYLDLDGNVFYADHDTYRMEMVPESNDVVARDAIAARARTFPDLLELIR